jgi:oxygen-independent coproporphyrinogen-3 oxidase
MREIKRKPIALYVHIPFCVKKCDYCDFLSAPASEQEKKDYVNLLCREIEKEAACYPDYRATTVLELLQCCGRNNLKKFYVN